MIPLLFPNGNPFVASVPSGGKRVKAEALVISQTGSIFLVLRDIHPVRVSLVTWDKSEWLPTAAISQHPLQRFPLLRATSS
ncbi:hypothetical protein FKM82_018108 [Ascaphus truei]